ncbi:endonuclease/exonuclease/phosphatase family protein [Salinarimonas sp.]|uniref:endonuclease/exonuclease/phosphatase family protein n=1 Tax=Salinarimonas sp. TaxID=2766526 RepID=UPI00391CDE5D
MRDLFVASDELKGYTEPAFIQAGSEYVLFSANIQNSGADRAAQIAEFVRNLLPDILILSELKRKPATISLLEHLRRIGYNPLDLDDDTEQSQYHVVVGSRLRCVELKVSTESLRNRLKILRLEAHPPFEPVYVVAVYAPAYNPENLALRRRFFDDLQNAVLRRLHSTAKNAFIVGDLNIVDAVHHAHVADFAAESAPVFSAFASTGFVDLLRRRFRREPAYTWYSPRTGEGQRLDHLFARGKLVDHVGEVAIDHDFRICKLSDHSAITCRFRSP